MLSQALEEGVGLSGGLGDTGSGESVELGVAVLLEHGFGAFPSAGPLRRVSGRRPGAYAIHDGADVEQRPVQGAGQSGGGPVIHEKGWWSEGSRGGQDGAWVGPRVGDSALAEATPSERRRRRGAEAMEWSGWVLREPSEAEG